MFELRVLIGHNKHYFWISKHAGHLNTRFVHRYVEISNALFFQQGTLSAYDACILYEVILHVRAVQYLLFIRLNRLKMFSSDLEGLQIMLSILYSH